MIDTTDCRNRSQVMITISMAKLLNIYHALIISISCCDCSQTGDLLIMNKGTVTKLRNNYVAIISSTHYISLTSVCDGVNECPDAYDR
jgi:hypothetical protein